MNSDSPASGPLEILPIQAAALEHLTGPNRGKSVWLTGTDLKVWLLASQQLRVTTPGADPVGAKPIATLHYDGETFVLSTISEETLWVNKAPVSTVKLKDRDVVEFGDIGPISRFRLYNSQKPAHKLVTEIFSDGISYLRVSRQPVSRRIFRFVSALFRRLTQETTVLFRIGVIVSILVLAGVTYQQNRVNSLVQQQIQQGALQIEGFAQALARARAEALSPADLRQLGNELGSRLSVNAERLANLEQRSDASSRIIAEAITSILFLQGAYGFRETLSGRLMRHVLDDAGKPVISAFGQPLLTLDGEGPVAERQFSGTGFVIGDAGLVVTNRHVALPWENDATVQAMRTQGLEPVMIKQIAYVKGQKTASPIEIVKVSDVADLAILQRTAETHRTPGLQMATTLPKPGDEVIVLGFPTGLRAMLAQSGKAFIEELQKTNDTGFWSIGKRLAERGYIAPLASRGIVGQVSAETIVYDADTTHGGSGGPVLDIHGRVIAVNSAILPEYGGSNLGIPIAKVGTLLQDSGLNSGQR